MTSTHTPQNSYSKEELLACGRGEIFGAGNAQLPLPNMLMIDRIVNINSTGGKYGKGEIIAELDINPDLWFFRLPFRRRPRHARLFGFGRHVATGRLLSGMDGCAGTRSRSGLRRSEIQRPSSAEA